MAKRMTKREVLTQTEIAFRQTIRVSLDLDTQNATKGLSVVTLSPETYIIKEDDRVRIHRAGQIVRLISGYKGSSKLGNHFDKDWVCVCPVGVDVAKFWGVPKDCLELIL